MDTKGVGNIGEAKVLCKFVELGIPVYLPFGDNERSDLIAEFNGFSIRIARGYETVNNKTKPIETTMKLEKLEIADRM